MSKVSNTELSFNGPSPLPFALTCLRVQVVPKERRMVVEPLNEMQEFLTGSGRSDIVANELLSVHPTLLEWND